MSKFSDIRKEFYDIFEQNSQESYELRKDLDRYVKESIYCHLTAHHDLEITYEQWLKQTFNINLYNKNNKPE